MKAVIILFLLTYTAISVVNAQCERYMPQTWQNATRRYDCIVGGTRPNTTVDTPLGFQCVQMTYPEATMDINDYPCRTVDDVAGRHIEVLVEPVGNVRTCIVEDGFEEQCSSGINIYCRRIQGSGNSAIIRIYCLGGAGCDMSSQLLWFRIVLSPDGEDAENWCLTRSSDTPSSLLPIQQPSDSTHDFDQDGPDPRRGGFSVLQPVSVATLFMIVMLTKLML